MCPDLPGLFFFSLFFFFSLSLSQSLEGLALLPKSGSDTFYFSDLALSRIPMSCIRHQQSFIFTLIFSARVDFSMFDNADATIIMFPNLAYLLTDLYLSEPDSIAYFTIVANLISASGYFIAITGTHSQPCLHRSPSGLVQLLGLIIPHFQTCPTFASTCPIAARRPRSCGSKCARTERGCLQ